LTGSPTAVSAAFDAPNEPTQPPWAHV
jgi:hypothetical protein